jgi:uroporphyrinogen-III synthase
METLLLTRARPESAAFAADLEAVLPGRFRVVVSPLRSPVFRTTPLDVAGVDALVFTSANGVRAYFGCPGAAVRPAFCVGRETAAAGRAAGLPVRCADGDAEALLSLVAGERPQTVLHPRGEQVSVDIARRLGAMGIRTRAVVLYGLRDLPPTAEAEALARAGAIGCVAVFSARSARRLVAVAAGWRLGRTVAVAISQAASEPLAALRMGGCRIAAHPSRQGMIAALAAL